MITESRLPAREQGTNPSIEAIFRDDLAFIIRLLGRLGVRPADVEDAAQEVLCGAHRALPKYDRSRGKLRTWLYRIAFNQAQMFRKRAHYRHEVSISANILESIADTRPDAEQQLLTEESRRFARVLLDSLEANLRRVLVAYELDHNGIVEVAVTLGIPVSTAWSRLRQGRIAFGAALKRWNLRHGESPLVRAPSAPSKQRARRTRARQLR